MNSKKETNKLLGLDVSTKTIGSALFEYVDDKLHLLELTHISPQPKIVTDNKMEELIKKAELFEDFIVNYKNLNITEVIIEEPLLGSQNVYTVATLLRFNTLVSKIIYDTLNIVPNYISTSDSRRHAYPQLVRENDKKRFVLFGGFPKDIDKKKVIWEEVCKLEPQIKWPFNRRNVLDKSAYDQSDAYTCVLGWVNMKNKGI